MIPKKGIIIHARKLSVFLLESCHHQTLCNGHGSSLRLIAEAMSSQEDGEGAVGLPLSMGRWVGKDEKLLGGRKEQMKTQFDILELVNNSWLSSLVLVLYCACGLRNVHAYCSNYGTWVYSKLWKSQIFEIWRSTDFLMPVLSLCESQEIEMLVYKASVCLARSCS